MYSRESLWSEYRIERLVAAYGTVPAREVARMLNVTRNAVIGKANRLGLCVPRITHVPRVVPAWYASIGVGCSYDRGERDFCCAPVAPGSPFCAEHRALCYLPASAAA